MGGLKRSHVRSEATFLSLPFYFFLLFTSLVETKRRMGPNAAKSHANEEKEGNQKIKIKGLRQVKKIYKKYSSKNQLSISGIFKSLNSGPKLAVR
jgi:hypothetical protein